jgi:DNA-directed RNA polymerase specialized sigma24 family protein
VLAQAEIAAGLGVSVKTLNAWMTAFNDFREAMSEAKELEYAWWLKVGRQNQFKRSWNASAWALQMRNRFRKRFGDRSPAKDETPEESVNAEQLRAEMERKLSRIADAGREDVVPGGSDAAGVEKPSV